MGSMGTLFYLGKDTTVQWPCCVSLSHGPKETLSSLVFWEYAYNPQDNGGAQLAAASGWTAGLSLFLFQSPSLQSRCAASPANTSVCIFSSFTLQHVLSSVLHANSSVCSSDGRAHRFVFHLHTPVEPPPRSKYRTFPHPRSLPRTSSQTPACPGVSMKARCHCTGLSGMCSCVSGFSYLP